MVTAIFAALGAVAGLAVLLLALLMWPTLPAIDNIAEDRMKIPLRVYSADGLLIGEFGEERRIAITIDETPKDLVHAVLAAEDKNFYSHWGVDFIGIARAAIANFVTGRRGQGASTITMQVARNFFLSPERTYTRKFKEILLAFKLEANLTKDEILELYLNKIYLGNRAYGFAAASKVYYGKSLSELALPELAMMAGLPKAPSRNNPIRNPENAVVRRNYVIGRMFELEYIDETRKLEAEAAPVTASRHRFEYDVNAPYVAEMVRRYMYETYREQSYGGGFHVTTTILSANQKAANEAVRKGLLAYERRHGYYGRYGQIKLGRDINKELMDDTLAGHRSIGGLIPSLILLARDQRAVAYTKEGFITELHWEDLSWARRYLDVNSVGRKPRKASDVVHKGDVVYLEDMGDGRYQLAQIPKVSGAMVSLNPSDGAILALTGGFDFAQSHFNRVEQAERQPGSNIKPFIYSAALENGYTAASTISGAPIVIEDDNLEGVWRPENYNHKFYGPTRLRKALMLSINTIAVRLLRSVGVKPTIDHLERFGFNRDKLPHNLSLALGSGSLTPMELVRAFAVFANGGYRVTPYLIASIKDSDGNLIEVANPTLVCPECPETEIQYGEFRATPEEEQPKPQEPEAQQPDGTGAETEPLKPEQAIVAEDTTGQAANEAVAEAKPEDADTEDEAAKADGPPPEPVYVPRFAPRVVRPENTYIMTTILRDVIKRGTGRRALELKRDDIGGKTGTTNDQKDAWFSGFNQQVVATAWVGFDQPTTLGRGEAGSRTALPIWIEYMRVALKNMPEKPLEVPENIVSVFVDAETGRATTAKVLSETPEPDKPKEATEDPLAAPAGGENGEQTAQPDIDPAEDPDAPDEPEEPKPEPVEEFFIAGTEPKVEITESGEQRPVGEGKPADAVEGLF